MPTSNEQQQLAVEQAWRVNPETPSVIITPHGRISISWARQAQGESADYSLAEQTAAMIVEAVNARALDAASTKQAGGHSEFCSAQVGPVEDCPVCADPVDVAEIVERLRAYQPATMDWGSDTALGLISEAADLIERFSASTDRYAQGIEAAAGVVDEHAADFGRRGASNYRAGRLDESAACQNIEKMLKHAATAIRALSPDTGRDSGGGR